jgi:hypothetical protein
MFLLHTQQMTRNEQYVKRNGIESTGLLCLCSLSIHALVANNNVFGPTMNLSAKEVLFGS